MFPSEYCCCGAEAEHQAQAILHKAGIACPQPVQNVHGALTSIEKITYQTEDPTWAQNNGEGNASAAAES